MPRWFIYNPATSSVTHVAMLALTAAQENHAPETIPHPLDGTYEPNRLSEGIALRRWIRLGSYPGRTHTALKIGNIGVLIFMRHRSWPCLHRPCAAGPLKRTLIFGPQFRQVIPRPLASNHLP